MKSKVSSLGYVNSIQENILSIKKKELAPLYEELQSRRLRHLQRIRTLTLLTQRRHEPNRTRNSRLAQQSCPNT